MSAPGPTVNHPDKSGRQIPRAPGEDDHTYADRVRDIFAQWKADHITSTMVDVTTDPPGGTQGRPWTSVDLTSLDTSLPPPLLLDRLDPREGTILYGPGGVGKGSLASSWIVQLVRAGKRVLILDYENHGGEWARRIDGLGGDIGDMVEWVAPLVEGRGAIWQDPAGIRALIVAHQIDYIVIDSVVYACGGADPAKAEVAIQYGSALQVIDTPSLSLGHVTKLHDPKYPFGSAFWHNGTRVSWSLMPKGDDTLLVCRKHNNYANPGAATVDMTWRNDVLREVRERPAMFKLEDQIAEALIDGPLSPVAISDALNAGLPPDERTSRDTIRKALNRDLKKRSGQRFTVDAAGRYSLRPLAED